jgi:hypothetical protein
MLERAPKAAPIDALADALAGRGMDVSTVFVTSLKDPEVQTPLARPFAETAIDVIPNATAYSARVDDGGVVLDAADTPASQGAHACSSREQWAGSTRGLGAAAVLADDDFDILLARQRLLVGEAERPARKYQPMMGQRRRSRSAARSRARDSDVAGRRRRPRAASALASGTRAGARAPPPSSRPRSTGRHFAAPTAGG